MKHSLKVFGRTSLIAAEVAVVGLVGTVVARAVRSAAPSTGDHERQAPLPSLTADEPYSAPTREGIAQRLSRMIQIPTVSAHLAETGPAPFDDFEGLIAELYPEIARNLEREKVTDYGIVYHWKGGSSSKPLVLMAHYDVVPVDTSDPWRHPAFEGAIEDGSVWGRGALDDKGSLLIVLEAVENLLADGYTPPQDVYLVLGGNEETHGAAAEAIAQTFRERGIIPWLVQDEGGAIVDPMFPGVTIPLAMVGVGEKGAMTATLTVRGEAGHASAPGKGSPIDKVARAILRLAKSPFPAKLSEPVKHMLEALAPHASFAARLALANLWLFERPIATAFAYTSDETAAMTHTTIAVTKVTGGTAENVLPSSAAATLNIRIAPGDTVESVLETLRETIHDDEVDVELVIGHDPSPISPTDCQQFELIRSAVQASYPEVLTSPYLVMAATDSRWFHEFAPNVYRFSPLIMTAAHRVGLHGVNEHIAIESLINGEHYVQTLIQSLPTH